MKPHKGLQCLCNNLEGRSTLRSCLRHCGRDLLYVSVGAIGRPRAAGHNVLILLLSTRAMSNTEDKDKAEHLRKGERLNLMLRVECRRGSDIGTSSPLSITHNHNFSPNATHHHHQTHYNGLPKAQYSTFTRARRRRRVEPLICTTDSISNTHTPRNTPFTNRRPPNHVHRHTLPRPHTSRARRSSTRHFYDNRRERYD